ncbi:hypothetical protein D3C73_1396350 [compost metagenome]
MRRTFHRCQESCPNLHALRPKGKRCGYTAAVSNAAGCNYGNRYAIGHLRN